MSTATRSNTHELSQRRKVEAALGNEQLTRQRVEKLERLSDAAIRKLEVHGTALSESHSFRARGFMARLRWLFLGK